MTAYAKFKRQPLPSQLQQQMQTTTIPAPTRGIIMNENEAFMQPGGAIVCDNWAPTMRGVKLRGGCVRWATLPENTPVISGFEFISGNNQRIFAGNATKLYDVTTSTPVLIKSGQLSGNYVASQMANQSTPPDHMLVCNDAGDYVLHFDGTTWTTFNAGQITYAGGGTTTATGHNLTYVWKYRGRFYFIEGGTMNAYCLGINAYQGALNLIPLAGACTKGGKLLFGATWSVDAGDGIDDKCVFGTDQGELLIFTGSNPTDPNNWRQEGRYAISPPMGMNAHIGVGGDLLMMSVDGIVPISASITMSPGQLELAAITRQIKPMWRDEVNAKRSWSWTMKKWDEYGGIFVTWPGGSPGNRYCAVINNATGAWCRFVGWDATCFMRLRGDMFFGTQDGYIMQADRTGYDDGKPYVATLVGGWEMFQSPSETITWRQSRAAFTSGAGEPFQPQLAACTDYVVTLPTPPPAGPDPGVADVWDQGLWAGNIWTPPVAWANAHAYAIGNQAYDGPNRNYWTCAVAHTSAAAPAVFAADRAAHPTYWTLASPQPGPPVPSTGERAAHAQWDQPSIGRAPVRNTMWVSIGQTGFSHAPVVQVTVGQQAKPNVELISIAATFDRLGVNV